MLYWQADTTKDVQTARCVIRKLRAQYGEDVSPALLVKHLKSAGLAAFITDDDLGPEVDLDLEK